MENKREILIKMLHGNLDDLDGIPEELEKQDIYDETGHVDTDFLTEIIKWMSRLQTTVTSVHRSLNKMLGIKEEEEKEKKKDKGAILKPSDVLKQCVLEDGILKLPQIQLNKNVYGTVKQYIEEAGGSWVGGKIQGFSFPFNPDRVFNILKQGQRCNLAQDYQFFETPEKIADWLVSLVGEINDNDTVLEPSAGRGAIVKAVHRVNPKVVVECCELMPENREFLHALDNVILLDEDFTKDTVGRYSKIVANPPFSNNQDITHVRKMYEHLELGGTVAAITSAHWKISTEKKCEDFKKWLNEVDGRVYEIGSGEFKESGTSVNTLAVVITKKKEEVIQLELF